MLFFFIKMLGINNNLTVHVYNIIILGVKPQEFKADMFTKKYLDSSEVPNQSTSK
ncbi:hypothetical protein AwErysi_07050 [Erysipelotrichaceae bacterium]|nr:hypothetical protein AwErysi_07050 [Erysipelotrichaceae bacterium]